MPDTKINILFVDDEPVNLLAFKSGFRRDYNVTTETTGKEALERMQEREFQIVISDQRMPDMKGVELLATVADEFPAAVRILLTGFADIEAVIDAINKGKVYSYVTKPWNSEELRQVIENATTAYRMGVQNLELQEKYEQLFELVPYPVILMDTKASIVQANTSAVSEFGYSREDLHTQNYTQFFEGQTTLENILKRIKEANKLDDYEVTVRKKDGSPVRCLMQSTPIKPTDRYGATYQLVFVPQAN